MDPSLQQRIAPAMWRVRFRRLAVSLTVIWSIAAIAAVSLYLLNRNGTVDPADWPRTLFWSTSMLTLLAIAVTAWLPVSREALVSSIENQFPELDSALLTAAEQQPTNGHRFGFLQMDVMRQAIAHSYQEDWAGIVPRWQITAFPALGLVSLFLFFAALMGLIFHVRPLPPDDTIAFSDAVLNPGEVVLEVEPGNTEVEQGSSVLVMAKFPQSVPVDATLVFSQADGETIRLPMERSLDDPMFGARIPNVASATDYHIEYNATQTAADQSGQFRINVFTFPELVQADAELTFPEYTQQPPRKIQDVRRISAVEQTQVAFQFHVNKELVDARLEPVIEESGEPLPALQLKADPGQPNTYNVAFPMVDSSKWKLVLTDAQQRTNRLPPTFVLKALRNQPPKLKVVAPGRDIEVSPLEEVVLAVETWDDFGVSQLGVTYSIAGQEPVELKLDSETLKGDRLRAQHLMALESLNAAADDLVTYHFWAEDDDSEGNPRRVVSDIFFAEVRPLEQIFRQGAAQPDSQSQQQQQQQQQQSGQNAQQAEQLAELQKQIIAATWNVLRRERELSEISAAFTVDVQTISESQETVGSQVESMAQQVQDPKSQGVVSQIRTLIADVVDQLNAASSQQELDLLEDAMASQQAVYAAFLKLRAREMEVSRQQQNQSSQQQSGQQNNRAQQQLNELQLDDDRNRYEQEKTAAEEQETPEAQEDRRVLNELKDLARRQEDLNEQIKELVNALEEAETAEDQEELERRLKSLREQQEQMLRDAEELLQRMNEEQNRERMSEQAEQLEETRENLRRAAESLDEREVSQAAAEGTRAQRDLENLRDEFKQRAAGEFNEQMRDMRNRAQEIEQRQQEIAQQMQAESSSPVSLSPEREPGQRRSLQDEEPARDLDQELAQQQQDVENLRREMRETIEAAEDVEPLLAETLYETFRNTEANRPDKALEDTRRALSRGWDELANDQQRIAQDGIEKMREGIEKAAQQVLGDPTEALRNAERTLEDLKEGVESEIQEATGEESAENRDGQPSSQPGENGQSPAESEPEEGQQSGRSGEQSADNDSENTNPEGQQSGRSGQSQDPQGQQQPRQGQPGGGNSGESQPQGQDQPDDSQSQPPDQNDPQDSESQQSGRAGNQSGNNQQGQPAGNRGNENDEPSERERQNDLINRLGNQNRNENGGAQDAAQQAIRNAGNQRMMRPIAGDDFREFYDRLRDVENG